MKQLISCVFVFLVLISAGLFALDSIPIPAIADISPRPSLKSLFTPSFHEILRLETESSEPFPFDNFGYSMAIDGDLLVATSPYADSMCGRAYVFQRNQGGADGWGQAAELVPDTSAVYFGLRVAISGDTVALGAPQEPIAGKPTGAVYVFERNAGGAENWGRVRKITLASGPSPGFGFSVALDNDTLVATIPYFLAQEAEIYVFERNAGGAGSWGLVKTIDAPMALYSIAAGEDRIVAGSPANSALGGLVTIYERNHGGLGQWGEVTSFNPPDGSRDQYFGSRVALDGDMVAVSTRHKGMEFGGGSVYLFERNRGGADNWGHVKKLVSPGGDTGDLFGLFVTVSGDKVVVGAPYEILTLPGAAWVFARNEGGADNWGHVARLSASGGLLTNLGNEFGTSAAMSADFLAVGASGFNGGQGAVHIFALDAMAFEEVARTEPSPGFAGDQFGFTVAVDRDLMAVGAPFDDAAAGNAGAVYLFECNRSGADQWGLVRRLTASDAAAGDGFGGYLDLYGDTLVVGAPLADASGFDSGAAYVFERNRGGADQWGEAAKLTAADGSAQDYFGSDVAIWGDVAAVGAFGDDDLFFSSGSAYVFRRDAGGMDHWQQVRKIRPSASSGYDLFGHSVALSHGVLVVGAPSEEWRGMWGAAFVFRRHHGGIDEWGEVARLSAGGAGGRFGISVDVAGDKIVAGALSRTLSVAKTVAAATTRAQPTSSSATKVAPIRGAWRASSRPTTPATSTNSAIPWRSTATGSLSRPMTNGKPRPRPMSSTATGAAPTTGVKSRSSLLRERPRTTFPIAWPWTAGG